ncbi:MAG: hypothetical protein Q9213_001518 [Squamulea squamosa]
MASFSMARIQAVADAKRLVQKPWLIAQLRLHDIPFKTGNSVAALKELLNLGIEQGQCDSMPSRIVTIKDALKKDYDVKNAAHIAQQRRVKHKQFSRLLDPITEANYDIDMFLAKYFLDSNGNPTRTKTTVPISLPGFGNRSFLYAAAEKIQGLKTVNGGYGNDRTVVVGWENSHPSVWEVAGQVGKVSYETRKKMREANWNRTLQIHRSFVYSPGKPGDRFDIAFAEGEFAIDFKATAEQWIDNSENMTLTIGAARGLNRTGAFQFGIVEGMMRFDTDQHRLLAWCAENKDGECSETSGDEGAENDGNDTSEQTPSEQLRGLATGSAPPAKRRKRSRTVEQRRLHFQWRGRETGEGKIQLGNVKSHAGHLDFVDNACTKFEGYISLELMGQDLAFTGYKISAVGGPVKDSWTNYSKNAYDHAKRAG